MTKQKLARLCRTTKWSVWSNVLIATGKLVIGLLTSSLFLSASALYNMGMAAAKYRVLCAFTPDGEQSPQPGYRLTVGLAVVLAGIAYMGCSVRLFTQAGLYALLPMEASLAIAAFTFFDITLNIKGLWESRRYHTALPQTLKLINLASSFIGLALTQTALLSLSYRSPGELYSINGFSGLFFGACAAATGVFIMLRRTRTRACRTLTPPQEEAFEHTKRAPQR